jgi:hypothetical protein
MSKTDDIVGAAERVAATLEALLDKMEVRDSGEARLSACLFLTIGELYIAVLGVLRSRAQSHAPVLVRSMLEAFADLLNLVADSSYTDQMRFDNADQMLKTFGGFQEALKDDKDALKKLGEWIARERAILDETKAKGYKSLTISERFKRAELVEEYATGYRFFCSFSHSDINTLLARHADTKHLRFTDALPIETLKSVLSTSINIYGRAAQTLPMYTNISAEEVKAAVDRAEAIWAPI